jgi:hypothetical protein
MAIRTGPAYMRQIDGAKVTRLTLGELRACLVAGDVERCRIGEQQSAEAIVAANVWW